MGKSFNDDIFNNKLNLGSINGLSISNEAIEENKKPKTEETKKPKIDVSSSKLNEVKERIKAEKKKQKKDPQKEYEELIQEQKLLKEREKQNELTEKYLKQVINDDTNVKKTMIFKQEHLDIINGLASINDMQIKDVLNQLLARSISQLDETIRNKALKTGKKLNQQKQKKASLKTEKSIF